MFSVLPASPWPPLGDWEPGFSSWLARAVKAGRVCFFSDTSSCIEAEEGQICGIKGLMVPGSSSVSGQTWVVPALGDREGTGFLFPEIQKFLAQGS